MASGSLALRKFRTIMHPSRLKFYKFSTKPCTHKGFKCPKTCIEGYAYCIRHILQDENAPFQQCSYSYSFNAKRCLQAAPKEMGESFCPEHLHKIYRTRNRTGKSQPPLSAEKLLSSLSHYVKSTEDDNPIDPFTDIDATKVNESLSNTLLDYCSESDSDVDSSIIARTVRCKDEESSDAESLDSTGEDSLKFASVMTTDEVLLRALEKTNRLKTLYTEQLNRLKHVLKEKRRDYLVAIQKEKETLGPITEQKPTSARELKLLDKLRCYNQYRKYHGVEAILKKKMKNKRKGLAVDAQATRFGGTKCVFTEGGVKCNVRTLPNAKYCPKHILNDPCQVLFRACGFVCDDNICKGLFNFFIKLC